MKTHDTPEKSYDLERLIFFSDGVFAIAITLLVIELHPPEGWDGSWLGLYHSLLGRMACYVISFSALAAFWTAHRFMFRHVQRFAEPVSLLNLVFLFCMSLISFGNALLLEHANQPVAIAAFIGLICIASAILALMWGLMALVLKLVDPRIGLAYRWLVLARFLLMPPAIALVSIWIGQHFGIGPSVIVTAIFVTIAGRFGVKPIPSQPSVKEV